MSAQSRSSSFARPRTTWKQTWRAWIGTPTDPISRAVDARTPHPLSEVGVLTSKRRWS